MPAYAENMLIKAFVLGLLISFILLMILTVKVKDSSKLKIEIYN